MSEIDELLATIPTQVLAYSEISALARGGKYPEALEKLKASPLNESTKQHLNEVLDTGDQYLVDRTLNDLETRLAQALCWGCWRT